MSGPPPLGDERQHEDHARETGEQEHEASRADQDSDKREEHAHKHNQREDHVRQAGEQEHEASRGEQDSDKREEHAHEHIAHAMQESGKKGSTGQEQQDERDEGDEHEQDVLHIGDAEDHKKIAMYGR